MTLVSAPIAADPFRPCPHTLREPRRYHRSNPEHQLRKEGAGADGVDPSSDA
jgi:hypothetical protein